MPSDNKYKRWDSERDEAEENQSFPEMDELEVDYEEDNNSNSRVMKVVVPKRRSRRIPLLGSLDVTSKSVFIVAVCCTLCIAFGLVLGLSLVRNPPVEILSSQSAANTQSDSPYIETPTKSTARPESAGPSAAPAPSAPKVTTTTTPLPPKVERRDFTSAVARRFESYLDNKQINTFVKRLDRITPSQIPNYVASTLRYRGLSVKTIDFVANISRADENNPNTVEFLYSNGKSEVINEPELSDGSYPFAAYSPAGDVEGPVVYAHKGSVEDFDTLRHLKVSLRGCIALIRQVTDAEAAQVVRAQSAGAIGVLLYPDPDQFRGNGMAYPNGTGLPEDGVIFPNVKRIPGDPSTVMYPSIEHVYRKANESMSDILPTIPVQPISFKTAKMIFDHLGGSRPPSTWTNDYISALGRTWADTSPVENLRLTVNNIIESKKVTNVHAWLPCEDTSKVIHIGAAQGNKGGAAVGLAALLAIGQGLKAAFQENTGRRIMLSAWAESHQGFIGSTEFTELQHSWLGHSALAYLNIGPRVGIKGGLRVRGSPILHDVVRKATEKVSWPKHEYMSVLEGWRMGEGKEYDIAFENLGCLSDAVSFAATLGVPSVQFSVSQPQHPSSCREGYCDVCFDEREEHPLSDSQYDTTEAAMSTVDPNLDWSKALASMVGNTALVLSESPVPPANFKSDFSENLIDGWWSFLHHHLNAINSVEYNFVEILEAIRHELYQVESHMKEVSTWYSKPEPKDNFYQSFRHSENRLNFFLQVSRNLLGPRGFDRHFSTTLAGQSDLVESVILTHRHLKDMPYDSSNTTTPATTKKGKNNVPEKVSYKKLSFAHFYREEDKQRPHIWFPQVTEALRKALDDKSLLTKFHEELSLLLSALKSFKNI